jgi:hypothetical protein
MTAVSEITLSMWLPDSYCEMHTCTAREVHRTATRHCINRDSSRNGMLPFRRTAKIVRSSRHASPGNLAGETPAGEGGEKLARSRRSMGVHGGAGFPRVHHSDSHSDRLELEDVANFLRATRHTDHREAAASAQEDEDVNLKGFAPPCLRLELFLRPLWSVSRE